MTLDRMRTRFYSAAHASPGLDSRHRARGLLVRVRQRAARQPRAVVLLRLHLEPPCPNPRHRPHRPDARERDHARRRERRRPRTQPGLHAGREQLPGHLASRRHADRRCDRPRGRRGHGLRLHEDGRMPPREERAGAPSAAAAAVHAGQLAAAAGRTAAARSAGHVAAAGAGRPATGAATAARAAIAAGAAAAIGAVAATRAATHRRGACPRESPYEHRTNRSPAGARAIRTNAVMTMYERAHRRHHVIAYERCTYAMRFDADKRARSRSIGGMKCGVVALVVFAAVARTVAASPIRLATSGDACSLDALERRLTA